MLQVVVQLVNILIMEHVHHVQLELLHVLLLMFLPHAHLMVGLPIKYLLKWLDVVDVIQLVH